MRINGQLATYLTKPMHCIQCLSKVGVSNIFPVTCIQTSYTLQWCCLVSNFVRLSVTSMIMFSNNLTPFKEFLYKEIYDVPRRWAGPNCYPSVYRSDLFYQCSLALLKYQFFVVVIRLIFFLNSNNDIDNNNKETEMTIICVFYLYRWYIHVRVVD